MGGHPHSAMLRYFDLTVLTGVKPCIISTEVAPFGGGKQSGLSREGSRHGMEDYLELKYLYMVIDRHDPDRPSIPLSQRQLRLRRA